MRYFFEFSFPFYFIFYFKFSSFSDHDRMVEYQTKLTTLVQRTLTLSIGRALFTLGTSPANTWHSVHVPELVTVGRVVGPQALTVSLEEPLRPDVLMWANFHNGVAAGLRIPRNTGFQLDSSWLRYLLINYFIISCFYYYYYRSRVGIIIRPRQTTTRGAVCCWELV